MVDILSDLRKRALRKRVWFGTLTFEERTLVGLIRNNIKIVKNATLATVIARLIGKLLYAIKNWFSDMIIRLGRPMAESAARAAYAMGWKDALKWPDDLNIVSWYGLTAYHCYGCGRSAG